MTHPTIPLQPLSERVLRAKYLFGSERDVDEVRWRVARALAACEDDPGHWAEQFFKAQQQGLIMAGRINAGAGTDRAVSLINCAVQPVGDSSAGHDEAGRPGIFTALTEAMICMRYGQGVGYNFSHIRPKGARVRKTGTEASGPVSFMDNFDAMCQSVQSAGQRRGAQMAILNVSHPDIEAFVNAKYTAKRWTQFNVSVGISDAFMSAVRDDAQWELVHEAEPFDRSMCTQRPDGQWVYRTVSARALWDQILKSTYDHGEPGVVFIDRVNARNNLDYCEVIEATNPCAEEPLPPYGVCCLASVNLAQMVSQPFTGQASFDFERFAALVKTAIRMLDNTLEITDWPLEAQRTEAHNKRRIGLGMLGLGSTFAMLNISYDSQEAVRFAARCAEALCLNSYEASVDLAKEKGAFPLFEVEPFLNAKVPSSLPTALRCRIAKYGLRNSHLNAIAPTGTIALSFGNNVSNGIEPMWAVEYERAIRQDGGVKNYTVSDYAALVHKEVHGDRALPPTFVTAEELSVADHLAILTAIQPWIDTSISKTVNIAEDYPFEDFKRVYDQAFAQGLNSLATFRKNDTTGTVLKSAKPAPSNVVALPDADRRLALPDVPVDAVRALRWASRRQLPDGNPAWTQMVHAPGGSFAVCVGHVEHQSRPRPFEAWVLGAEQPRGLDALAKLLSMDMRSNDRHWLKLKLKSLKRVSDQPIDLKLEADELAVRMPSTVAGLALIIEHRCERLGYFDRVDPGPMQSALMGQREPKSGPDGGLAWHVDIHNAQSGDDFAMFVKEAQLPDGTTRPFSVWFSGTYPKQWDGLCKCLSLDMRIGDLKWIATKLDRLIDHPEYGGEFMAMCPERKTMRRFSSTVSYVAQLLRHRYEVLGLGQLTDSDRDDHFASRQSVGAAQTSAFACRECGAYALAKRDGCSYCTACNAVGDCG